jgi:hypothetical protein
MKSTGILVRWVRFSIVLSVLWALAWSLVGMLVEGAIHEMLAPQSAEISMRHSAIFGVIGLLSGVSFSFLIGVAEMMVALHRVPLARLLLWGGLAGVVGGAVYASFVGFEASVLGAALVGFTSILGAVSAASTVLVGRCGERRVTAHSP